MKFTADEYAQKYVLDGFYDYSKLIKQLESIDENITLKELLSFLGDEYELIIVLGNTGSGINIINLKDKTIDEWTW